MAANWVITDPEAGYPGITTIGTTGYPPIGTVVRAKDTSTSGQGGCAFILLKCFSAQVVGNVVTYNQLTGATTAVPSTANLDAPLAVAMVANTSGTTNYGWFQVGGAAIIKKTAVKVSPSVPLYISATAGRLMSTAASGKQVMNMRTNNAATVLSATSTITALMQFPFAQGAVA